MDDGRVVGVDALPASGMIHEPGRRRRRRQYHRIDVVATEQLEQHIDVLELHRAVVVHHEGFAIELGAAVDENGYAARYEIAGEWKVVENAPRAMLLQHLHGGRWRLVCGRHRWTDGRKRPARNRNNGDEHRR